MSHDAEQDWRAACAVALVHLPDMGPLRLHALLDRLSPDVAWKAICNGAQLPPLSMKGAVRRRRDLLDRWRTSAKTLDPLGLLSAYRTRGIFLWMLGDDLPATLRNDPQPPAVLFGQGDRKALENRCVAIVGTRHCTHQGRDFARELGRELALAGVSVVSGLALGIDGAAHEGALEAVEGAPPIAVVGSGLDVVYPKRHERLWTGVREAGLIVSESPLGAAPEKWRFPARNRIIAGLAEILVVVESHERGGSLLTVGQAADRSVPVMAVPGSVRNPAARGTNSLLRDGCAPVCDVDDVLIALGDQPRGAVSRPSGHHPRGDEAMVREAVGREATSTADVLVAADLPFGIVARALAGLERSGHVKSADGWWWRVAAGDS